MKLQFRWGRVVVTLQSECDALCSTFAHIYRAFLDDEEVADHLIDRAIDAGAPLEGDGECQATIDGDSFQFDNLEDALFDLDEEISDRLLKDAPDCLIIHGAAVSKDDTTLILIGPSGHGKTTLALELVRRGWVYHTDEFSVIEPSGKSLRPFPRSAVRKFESRTPSGSNLPVPDEGRYRAHMLPDHRSCLTARPIGDCKIIFPIHDMSETPRAQRLTSAEACALMLPSVFDFDGNEDRLWPIMANLVSGSAVCEFVFNEARDDLDRAFETLAQQ